MSVILRAHKSCLYLLLNLKHTTLVNSGVQDGVGVVNGLMAFTTICIGVGI